MIKKGSKCWNNGIVNKFSEFCPGENFIEGRLHPPWNKGKNNVYTKETLNKMKVAKENFIPVYSFPEGHIPWNKGLNANSDERIRNYRDKQIGQKREGNYKSKFHWKGEGNPWFGKDRSRENSPLYKGKIYNRKYKNYRNKVLWLTEQNYLIYKDIINPNDYVRTLCGVEGGYQLDHIISIKSGFEENIAPEEIAKIENLQMLSWEENRKKWYGCV